MMDRFSHVVKGLLLSGIFFLGLCGAAGAETPAPAPKIRTVGIFINRINRFDIKNGIAEVDFWYWMVSRCEEASLQNLELSNGKLRPLGEVVTQKQKDLFYISRRYIAEANCIIDTRKFPFDRQKITLSFEDGELTDDQMRFEPDIRNSGIDPAFQMNEWVIRDIRYQTGVHRYPSSFGYLDIPSGQGSDYSQFTVEVELSRRGKVWQKVVKYFWAVIVSVLAGLFALLIRPADLDARFGMAVGALFANVGCSFLLAGQLPQTPGLSTAELVSYISLGFIMLGLLESIFSLTINNSGREKLARRVDVAVFTVFLISYAVIWCFIF